MSRAAFLILSIAFFGFLSPSYAGSIAKVVAISGTPSATGLSGSRALIPGTELFERDKITVGSGNAQILFVDGTRLVVGPGSTLVVEKFLLRGTSKAQDFSINALRGTFRFITGKSVKSAYDIKTANATIGIRGTGFDFWVRNNTGVAVLEGKVKLCNRNKNCVNLNAGCELGVAEKSASAKIDGQPKAQVINTRLPFINNQKTLRREFRLNTSACGRAFDSNLIFENQGRNTPQPREERSQRTPTTNPNGPP